MFEYRKDKPADEGLGEQIAPRSLDLIVDSVLETTGNEFSLTSGTAGIFFALGVR
jgi:hypothetical protein